MPVTLSNHLCYGSGGQSAGGSGASSSPIGTLTLPRWENVTITPLAARECVLAAPSCVNEGSAAGPRVGRTAVPLLKCFDEELGLAGARGIGQTGGADGLGNQGSGQGAAGR
jgi:hypothetical protein